MKRNKNYDRIYPNRCLLIVQKKSDMSFNLSDQAETLKLDSKYILTYFPGHVKEGGTFFTNQSKVSRFLELKFAR